MLNQLSTTNLMGELFGSYLRESRTAKGLSTRVLAANAGISQPYLSQLERGQVSPPSEDACVRLAEALGIDSAELLARRLVETGQLPISSGITVEQARALIRRLRDAE